jgi:hypothetical protein
VRRLRRLARRIRDWWAGLPATTIKDLEALEDAALARLSTRSRRQADREMREGRTVPLDEFRD